MKIAHVISTFPPDIGGMGRVAYDEVNELASRKHDVTVFTLAFGGSRYNDNSYSFRVERLKPFLRSGVAGFVPKLFSELKKFDVVHLHYPFYGAAEFVRISGVPYVTTYHMDAEPDKLIRKLISKAYDRVLTKNILSKSKKLLLVDRNYNFKFKNQLLGQVTYLKNGIDHNVFFPQKVTPYQLALDELEGKKIFLFVGNLMPVKGLAVLFDAITKISDENFRLLIVGSGYNEHYYRKMAEDLSISDKIVWLGSCYDQDLLSKYYNISEAVIIPSFSESFSMVVGEAMACGIPVISSDIPGLKDRVFENETGLLFSKGDPHSLNNVLTRFLNFNFLEKRRLGENGRKLIKEQFTLIKHVDELEKIYHSVI